MFTESDDMFAAYFDVSSQVPAFHCIGQWLCKPQNLIEFVHVRGSLQVELHSPVQAVVSVLETLFKAFFFEVGNLTLWCSLDLEASQTLKWSLTVSVTHS